MKSLTFAVSPGFCGFLLRFGLGLDMLPLLLLPTPMGKPWAAVDEKIWLWTAASVAGLAIGVLLTSRGKYVPWRRCEMSDGVLDNAAGFAATATGLGGLRLTKLVTHIVDRTTT